MMVMVVADAILPERSGLAIQCYIPMSGKALGVKALGLNVEGGG